MKSVHSLEIRPFRRPETGAQDLDHVAALYNRALAGRHGFFPITRKRLQERVLTSPWFEEELFLLALEGETAVGMIHGAILRDPCYEEGGAIELLAVAPEYRGRGLEARLADALLPRLEARRPGMIDAGGTFPLTPFYSVLMDGSERSGFFASETEICQTFFDRGFVETRRSLVMRTGLPAAEETGQNLPPPCEMHLRLSPRTPESTWLDHVFRDWPLEDSSLIDTASGHLLSRAIVAPMEELSRCEGQHLTALFGVHTPFSLRGLGYAATHLRLLLQHLARSGTDCVELHVYADNEPAVRLYRSVGFAEAAQTLTLRKAL